MPPPDQARWFTDHVLPHELALRGYLCGLALPADVHDLVQETYARLLQAHERGPSTSPRGLLFVAARNVARDLFRRRRATAKTFPITEIDGSRVFDESASVAESGEPSPRDGTSPGSDCHVAAVLP